MASSRQAPPARLTKLRTVGERRSQREIDDEIDAIGEKLERRTAEKGDEEPSRPTVQSTDRPVDPTIGLPLVRRRGRILADGSRRGAGIAAKLTAYLPPERARALEQRATAERKTLSELVDEALEAYGIK